MFRALDRFWSATPVSHQDHSDSAVANRARRSSTSLRNWLNCRLVVLTSVCVFGTCAPLIRVLRRPATVAIGGRKIVRLSSGRDGGARDELASGRLRRLRWRPILCPTRRYGDPDEGPRGIGPRSSRRLGPVLSDGE